MHPSKLVPILWISCLRKMCIGQRICHWFAWKTANHSIKEFRAWKNTLLTRAASIDNTGRDVIMNWVMEAFEEDRDLWACWQRIVATIGFPSWFSSYGPSSFERWTWNEVSILCRVLPNGSTCAPWQSLFAHACSALPSQSEQGQ